MGEWVQQLTKPPVKACWNKRRQRNRAEVNSSLDRTRIKASCNVLKINLEENYLASCYDGDKKASIAQHFIREVSSAHQVFSRTVCGSLCATAMCVWSARSHSHHQQTDQLTQAPRRYVGLTSTEINVGNCLLKVNNTTANTSVACVNDVITRHRRGQCQRASKGWEHNTRNNKIECHKRI